jgi:hypothetical protein
MNEGKLAGIFLLLSSNVSGISTGGYCTGVKLVGTLDPISNVVVEAKVGQFKVNCNSWTSISTDREPNGV